MNRNLSVRKLAVLVGLLSMSPIGQAEMPAGHGNIKNIAVAPLKEVGVNNAEAVVIADALRSYLMKTEMSFRVVDRARMEQILSEQRFQLLGVTNEDEAVKLGKILNVQEMVMGTLSKLGKTYYLTVTAINVETAEVRASQSIQAGSIKKMTGKLRAMAKNLSKAYK